MTVPTGATESRPTLFSCPDARVVDGGVRQIDVKSGLIVLKHGDLPNLAMGPMTMGFDVADKKMLKGLKVGQKVRFMAEMVGGQATVTELKLAQ